MDEQQKQRVMVAFIAFNIVLIFYQLLFNSGIVFGDAFSWGRLFLAFVFGSIAAGIAYGAMTMLDR